MSNICNTAVLVEPNRLQLLSCDCPLNINPPGFKGVTDVYKAYKGE